MIFDDFLKEATQRLGFIRDSVQREAATVLVDTFRDSHKIKTLDTVVDSDELLNTAIEQSRDSVLSIPYNVMTLHLTHADAEYFYVCTHGDGAFVIENAYMKSSGEVATARHCTIFHLENVAEWDGTDWELNFSVWDIEKNTYVESDDVKDFEKASHINNIRALLCTLAAMQAKGVEVETVTPAAALQKARAKRGKAPLVEYKVLKIGGISKTGRVIGVGRSHASPKSHWRRGHVRTIHRGTPEERKIPIPAVIVNGGTPGFVHKVYQVGGGIDGVVF